VVASHLAVFYGLSEFGRLSLGEVLRLAVGRYDAGWYHEIALHGYAGPQAKPAAAAFYPGFPLLVRALALPIPAHGVAAAQLLIANLALLVAAWCMYRIYAPRFGTPAAVVGLGLLVCVPPGLFLWLGFSESLFLACAAGAFLALERRRWALAGLAAGAACLTRSNGVLLAAPLLIGAVSGRAWRSPLSLLTGACLFAAGAGAYPLYLDLEFGDPLRYLHLQQSGWHHRLLDPRDPISMGWIRMKAAIHAWSAGQDTAVRVADAPAVVDDGLALIAGGVASVAGWFGLRPGEAAWILLVWLTPLLSFPVPDSLARYLLAAFPLFFLAGRLLARVPPVAVAVMLLGLAYQAELCFRLAQGYFVG
jgi:hypothetical protein